MGNMKYVLFSLCYLRIKKLERDTKIDIIIMIRIERGFKQIERIKKRINSDKSE